MTSVTTVVPTRNRRPYLARTLARLFAQVDVAHDVVLVDEASTDDTAAFLADLASRRSMTVIRHDAPKGVAAARNAGLAEVRTPWVAFCDDDDLWAPDKLAAQLHAADALPMARWACSGMVRIDLEDRIVGHQRAPASGDVSELMRGCNVVPGGGSGLLAQTALMRELGGYDPSLKSAEDFDMAVRLSMRSPVVSVDRPLIGYRVWQNTMSTMLPSMRDGHETVVRRWRGDLAPQAASDADCKARLQFGELALRNGQRWTAARDMAYVGARERSPRRLAGAALAVVAPGLVLARHSRDARDAVPDEWREEAEGWLRTAPIL